MAGMNASDAITDIAAALRRLPLVGMLGWHDVRQRYRRSKLGPFWLTISMGVMIATIGIVFGQIFKTPMAEFFPFLASGIILWTFMSAVINEGCSSFIEAEGIIKQLPVPLFVHSLRMIWRNILMLGHNLLILPLVFISVSKQPEWVALLALPGLGLLVLNLTWLALLLGVVCTRFRDLGQIVGSALQVLFYLTPIIWMPSLLPERAGMMLLDANPVYHLLSIVRKPLLGELPSLSNWLVSLGIAVIGWLLALLFYGAYKKRIAYWL